MRIDPKIEKPARTMLSHVMRGELDDLTTTIHAVGDDTYRNVIALSVAVATYIAIDVSGKLWPTDAAVREIARHTAANTKGYELNESEVYDFLFRTALGAERLDEVFDSAEDAAAIPLMATGAMLVSFCPRDKEWFEYLDVIEAGIEAAERIDLSVLPALMLRARRESSTTDRDRSRGGPGRAPGIDVPSAPAAGP
jgi:hypothetical protein